MNTIINKKREIVRYLNKIYKKKKEKKIIHWITLDKIFNYFLHVCTYVKLSTIII